MLSSDRDKARTPSSAPQRAVSSAEPALPHPCGRGAEKSVRCQTEPRTSSTMPTLNRAPQTGSGFASYTVQPHGSSCSGVEAWGAQGFNSTSVIGESCTHTGVRTRCVEVQRHEGAKLEHIRTKTTPAAFPSGNAFPPRICRACTGCRLPSREFNTVQSVVRVWRRFVVPAGTLNAPATLLRLLCSQVQIRAYLDSWVPSGVDDVPPVHTGDGGHIAGQHRPSGTRRSARHIGKHRGGKCSWTPWLIVLRRRAHHGVFSAKRKKVMGMLRIRCMHGAQFRFHVFDETSPRSSPSRTLLFERADGVVSLTTKNISHYGACLALGQSPSWSIGTFVHIRGWKWGSSCAGQSPEISAGWQPLLARREGQAWRVKITLLWRLFHLDAYSQGKHMYRVDV